MHDVRVELVCGHTVMFDIRAVDERIVAYCRFDGMQEMGIVHYDEQHFFCLDCSQGAWGTKAKRRLRTHLQAHPYHRAFCLLDTITPDGKGVAKEAQRMIARRATIQEQTFDGVPPPF